MEITDYILKDIDPLEEKRQIGDAQELFSQTTYSHIPITREGVYVGCLNENDVHCLEASELIADYAHMYEVFFVTTETNWLNVVEIFAQNSTNLMPVLDAESATYLGYYELADVMTYFNNTPFLNETGSIIVIEHGIHDFSFSEVSQIVESNDGKILGAFISRIANDVAQISIKIGADTSFNTILQAFRRYGYTIVSQHQEDAFVKELRERSQYLEKYLNI
ncbi:MULTISPECIES: acetoin utilization protein acuB [unclassified Leeuwenhoekiella]|uniref:acetoin utilization protein acuB n=1 Tax=unclassified Leeuwenhoekiella TaxID=2615029 RepID=UPI000C3B400F|nr:MULTISPECIES: acetoin utilization protein acuB [unclassified Leeuwenhoekiella]MAW96397.1 acetoin utilization protein acuB [Leeuwenhoekiella sp.]MBA81284.1 acetoin utilization protein acuB [Leeuwenhoekiella sp.]|tara:strand:+ start:33085 stop:33747 length:663 start_codon:yes stop_codon:yes gene_type:complete